MRDQSPHCVLLLHTIGILSPTTHQYHMLIVLLLSIVVDDVVADVNSWKRFGVFLRFLSVAETLSRLSLSILDGSVRPSVRMRCPPSTFESYCSCFFSLSSRRCPCVHLDFALKIEDALRGMIEPL